MKFSTREDIDLPADEAFAAVADFEMFESELISRGVELTREDESGPVEAGKTAWKAKTKLRGRHYEISARLKDFRPEEGYDIESATSGLETTTNVSVKPLTSRKSRLFVAIEIRPTSFAGRLFLQPMKLAKARLNHKFQTRVGDFAKMMARKKAEDT